MTRIFEKYMEIVGLKQVGHRPGMKMKEPNGVIEAWPYRMKKQAGEEGAQEEFETMLESFTQGVGRYVESVRMRKILNRRASPMQYGKVRYL